MELPWPKVQRRIAQLIADGTFLTEQERQPERQEQDARRYQVVVYHHSENGFDERMEYPTREEAEKVAQGYVDGTMGAGRLCLRWRSGLRFRTAGLPAYFRQLPG